MTNDELIMMVVTLMASMQTHAVEPQIKSYSCDDTQCTMVVVIPRQAAPVTPLVQSDVELDSQLHYGSLRAPVCPNTGIWQYQYQPEERVNLMGGEMVRQDDGTCLSPLLEYTPVFWRMKQYGPDFITADVAIY